MELLRGVGPWTFPNVQSTLREGGVGPWTFQKVQPPPGRGGVGPWTFKKSESRYKGGVVQSDARIRDGAIEIDSREGVSRSLNVHGKSGGQSVIFSKCAREIGRTLQYQAADPITMINSSACPASNSCPASKIVPLPP